MFKPHHLAAALAVGLLAPAAVAGVGTTQIVARSGQSAPDGNGSFGPLWPVGPLLDDAGRVAFRLLPNEMVGTAGGFSDNGGLFRWDGGITTQLVRSGRAASGGGTFGGLFGPTINNTGEIGFYAEVLNAPADMGRGIFRADASGITSVARAGQATPGGGTFASSAYPGISPAGEVGFAAGVTGGDSAWFIGDGMGVRRVEGEGMSLPGLGTIGRPYALDGSRPMPINAAGQVAFAAGAREAGGDSHAGLFIGSPPTLGSDAVVLLALEGQPTPDGTTRFTRGFDNFDLDAAGRGLFRALLDIQTDPALLPVRGLFLGDGDGLTEIARNGQNGLRHIGSARINAGGRVAFDSTVTLAGGEHGGSALFIHDGGTARAAVAAGTSMPGGGRLAGIVSGSLSLSDAGHAAFAAWLTAEDGEFAGEAVFTLHDRLGLLRVAGRGDNLAGDSIASLIFGGTHLPFDGSRQGGPNAAGQIAFSYLLEDGRDGIALWSPPEPVDGDANLDGIVSIADFAVLRTNFGRGGPGVYFQDGDFDGDRLVSITDFALLRANFGGPAADAAALDAWAAAVVPEPASLAAVAAGGLGLTRRRQPGA